MAVVTPRGILWSTTAGAKTVPSFTPGAGELLVAVVGVATSDTAPVITDTDATITGWTLVDTFRSQSATGGLRIYVSNQGASGSAITVTMTPTADAGGGLAVLSVTQPSAFGASAVRSSGGQADINSPGTVTPAPVLSNTPLTTNPVIVAVMTNSIGTANSAPRTGYTEHYDQGFNTPAAGIEVQSRNSGETSATLTLGAASPSQFASIAIEIATVAANNWTQPEDEAPSVTDAQAKGVTSLKADAITGVDVQAAAVISPKADAATVTDAIDPQLTEGAFSPADIAGLACWLKADAIGGADGDPVTTWEDSHTSNKDATGATGQTIQTNEINGLPVVRFDGVDDKLSVSGITNNDATRTIFMVAKVAALGALDAVWGFIATAAVETGASGIVRYRVNEALGTPNIGTPGTAAFLHVVRYNSTSSADLYYNSDAATNFDPHATYQAATGAAFTLASRTSAGANFGGVDVGEVLIYDAALADADLDDVRDYLTDKWFAAAAGHSQPVDDAIVGTDAQTKTWAAVRSQPDAIAGTDAQAKRTTRPQADAAAATDARAARVGHALADPVAGTDAAIRRVGSARSDTIAGTDARTSASAKPLSDQIAGTDARARVWAAKLTITDGLSATDNVSTSAAGANERDVNDAAIVTDALARTFQARRTVSDSAAGTDARAVSVRHPLTDSIAGTDARARVWAAKLTIADGISATDNVSIGAAGAREQDVNDSLSVTDAISVGHRRTLGDSLTVTDTSATQADYVRQPADAVAATDARARAWAIFEDQADGLTVTDAVEAGIPPARWPPDSDTDWVPGSDDPWVASSDSDWPPDTDDPWAPDTDEDWEAQTDDRWLVSAESKW